MSHSAQDFVEEAVLTLPPGCTPEGITADDHVFAFWQQPNGQIRFVWDGSAGEPFDMVVPMRDETRVFWSKDARHLAYMGMRGGKGFVGRDGGEDPEFEEPTRSVPPTFSSDGAHLVYGAQVGGTYRLIIDGTVADGESLAPIAAVFSPDGNRLAFVENRDSMDSKHEQRIVLDGEAGPWFRGMRNAQGVLQFSPDSRRFAYYRIDGEGGGQWVVDGAEHRWVDDVRPFGLAQMRGIGVLDPPMNAGFSPDSRRFVYFADVKEKGVAILEDDVAGPIVKAAGEPIFSADSRHVAYGAQSLTEKFFVVVDGLAGKEWNAAGCGDPVFSPDGAHVAWTLWRQEGGFFRKTTICALLVNDELVLEQPGDSLSRWPSFSSDGARVAWSIRGGKSFVAVVNAESGPTLAGGGEPVFTSSGHLVYVGQLASGEWTVFVDHQPGPRAQDLLAFQSEADEASEHGFRSSPDGEHIAWAGVFDNQTRPVIDDRVGPIYDQLVGRSFGADGVATWWMQRGEVIYRVRAQSRQAAS